MVCMLILLPVGAFAQQAPAETANPSEGIVHTVIEGDTLWSSANTSDPVKWTVIWERNRFLTNPQYLPGIQVVIVPPAEGVALGQERESDSGPVQRCRGPPPWSRSSRGSARLSSPRAVPRHKAVGFRARRDFSKERRRIGHILAGKDPRSIGRRDTVTLAPEEIRRPAAWGLPSGDRSTVRERPVSGYVKYLSGDPGGAKNDGERREGRQSFGTSRATP